MPSIVYELTKIERAVIRERLRAIPSNFTFVAYVIVGAIDTWSGFADLVHGRHDFSVLLALAVGLIFSAIASFGAYSSWRAATVPARGAFLFDTEGLRGTIDDRARTWPRSQVDSIADIGDFLVLYARSFRTVVIPKRAIADLADWWASIDGNIATHASHVPATDSNSAIYELTDAEDARVRSLALPPLLVHGNLPIIPTAIFVLGSSYHTTGHLWALVGLVIMVVLLVPAGWATWAELRPPRSVDINFDTIGFNAILDGRSTFASWNDIHAITDHGDYLSVRFGMARREIVIPKRALGDLRAFWRLVDKQIRGRADLIDRMRRIPVVRKSSLPG